jgi:hypothetical protein
MFSPLFELFKTNTADVIMIITVVLLATYSIYILYAKYYRNDNRLDPDELVQWFNEVSGIFFKDLSKFNTIVTIDRTEGRDAAKAALIIAIREFIKENKHLNFIDSTVLRLIDLDEIVNFTVDKLEVLGVLSKQE